VISKPLLLFLITEDWYFWSHRLSLARAARDKGFEVLICTRVHKHGRLIEQEGFKLTPIRLIRRNMNPLTEMLSLLEIMRIYKKERPNIVHHVAIKPILYGSLAAALARVHAVVNALGGLGHLFILQGFRVSLLRWLASFAYRMAFSFKRSRVIFQTKEDQETFVVKRIAESEKTVLIRGSGVDLVEFALRPEPEGIPVVMLAGRLLWNKGVAYLIEAAKLLRSKDIEIRIVLVGAPDPENPQSISEDRLRRWQNEGVLEWWGRRENMADVLAQANLVVLPTTYGEGIPKILLEAAAVGRAIIATDIPGCREIVRHQENGLLVPVNDVSALASAIASLASDSELRLKMGIRGREIVEADFAQERVVAETFAVYRELLEG
jgi:glycosyltransferase involved in cell wall biosynthesis